MPNHPDATPNTATTIVSVRRLQRNRRVAVGWVAWFNVVGPGVRQRLGRPSLPDNSGGPCEIAAGTVSLSTKRVPREALRGRECGYDL